MGVYGGQGRIAWVALLWSGLGCSSGIEDALDPKPASIAPTSGDDSAGDVGSGSSGEIDDGSDTGEVGTGGLGDSGDESGEGPAPLDPVCGDGVIAGTEECDEGPANGPTGDCTPQCTLAACGDGFVHATNEECDDGNLVDEDACLSNCVVATCGDGVKQQGVELCDDGNLDDTDGCTTTCTLASCGDGTIQPPEECDDGNASNADDCLGTCVPASCGDGFVHATDEGCDDGNASNADGCLDTCVSASCGDGYVQTGVEECDGGGDPTVYSCSDTCQDQQVWYQWSFFQGALPAPMACADFTSWRNALADDHTSITLAGTYDMAGRTCTGPAATQLCNALRLGMGTTVGCDGHTWRVGVDCAGTVEVTVDSTVCDCATPGYALRPCVPYVDWGGVGTSTCFGPSQEIYIECGFD